MPKLLDMGSWNRQHHRYNGTTMLFLGQNDYRTCVSTYDHADKERTMRQIDKLEEFIDSYSA